MRKIGAIVLVAAAAVAVTVTASGSAYAGDATTRIISPTGFMSRISTDYQDDLSTGCGSHRSKAPEATTSTGL